MMLRQSVAKAMQQELTLLRACIHETPQAAGRLYYQLQALHCMVQQKATPNRLKHHDQPDSSPPLDLQQSALQATEQHQQRRPRHIEQFMQQANGFQHTPQKTAQQLHQQNLGLQQLQRCQSIPASQLPLEIERPLQPHHTAPSTASDSSHSRNGQSTASSNPSSTGITSIPGDGAALHQASTRVLQNVPHPEDAFNVSSLQQQYQLTLESLRMGHSRNIAQLAQMFDPHAVLAAPDKGAAILEALMFGAAKLGDMQLLAQLLRCCEAAEIPLSPSGHTAVLHGLAHSGQASRAKRWLQEEVPPHIIRSSMLRAVVQPLLQQGHVQTADEILRWVDSRLHAGSRPLAGNDEAASNGSCSSAAAHEDAHGLPLLLQDSHHVLPCLRLMVAGAKRSLAAVQSEWAAIQQQQHEVAKLLQASGSQCLPHHHPHLLCVPVWASYVSALCKANKAHGNRSHNTQVLLRHAVQGLANVYHTTAWNRWAGSMTARTSEQQEHAVPATAGQQAVDWWQQQQQQSQQVWQQLGDHVDRMSWQQLDPSTVLPQEVTGAVNRLDKDAFARALDAALHVAADHLDEEWMEELLKMAALLKAMPGSWGFDALLNFKLWHGQTPEAMEEVLGELMGWGVTPTLAHYEHLAEAYALHGKHGSATAVLDRICAAGHTPVLRTYNRLLHSLAGRGELRSVNRVYLRLRMQGLVPDQQTIRALFKCVRMYASNVRVLTARRLGQLKPGDRKSVAAVLFQRAGLFASAYSQLVEWQGELVAAGLKHNDVTMHQLLAALERLGAVEDCVQLAKLHEEIRPGKYTAHRFALRAAGRMRSITAASKSADLAASLASGHQLSQDDYRVLIAIQFWLNRDHQQLLQTIAAMRAAGHDLDQTVLLQVLHVYCHFDMWSEALRVLDDVAAGRVGAGHGLLGAEDAISSVNSRDHSNPADTVRKDNSSTAGKWPRQYQASDYPAHQAGQDALWHIVMRKLWEQRAADSLLNEFLQRMSPEQLQRFTVLYNIQPSPNGGYTMQPLEDWQVPAETLQASERAEPHQHELSLERAGL